MDAKSMKNGALGAPRAAEGDFATPGVDFEGV